MGYKLTLSFTNKEEYLYKYVTEHSSYSGFLKDILKDKYQNEQKEKKIVPQFTLSKQKIYLKEINNLT